MTFAGVVLAAGAGTRLRPLTEIRPKALCPVANVPLVDLAIERVRQVAPDVAANVHHHRDQMEAHLAGRVHLSIEEGQALGTAGALGRLRDWIAGRPVVVANADSWHRFPLALLVEGFDGERPRLLGVPAEPGREGDFGPWRYVGACVLPWADVAALVPEPSGLYETTWRRRQEEGTLDVVPAPDGPWFDCGTPSRYLAANLAANDGESVIGPGAVVEGEVVRSVVWDGARVERGERLVECVRAQGGVTVHAPLAVSR